MKSEEIIGKHIGKLTKSWFDKKLAEFQKSPFFLDDKLFNDKPIIKEYTTCDYDDEGKEINPEIKLIEHDESKFDLTFNEFALSSKSYFNSMHLLSVYGDTEQWLQVENYDPSKQVEDIDTLAKFLAKQLFEYGNKFISSELYDNYLESVKISVKSNLDLIHDSNIEPFKEIYFDTFKSEIEALFSNYLENKYHIKNEDSLNFEINLEELSALFAIIQNAGFIQNKKELLLFASKHFKISNQEGEGYINIIYRDFQDRLNKQRGNKKHRTKALEDINEKLYYSFDRLIAFKIS
jgi:hypothetical protein